MGNKRTYWHSWYLTRVIFAVGAMTFFSSIFKLVTGNGYGWWLGVVAGVVLVALATRGPWDAAGSGRNRSVIGFKARREQPDRTPQ
ncbi:MAG: hypothetical protein WBX27_15875 [Specibacter sp.]